MGQTGTQLSSKDRVYGDSLNAKLRPYGLQFFESSQALSFEYNLLSPPVPLSQQTYEGQRPTFTSAHNPTLTWDLRQLHIRGGQLAVEGSIQRNSWYPSGPEATGIGQIFYYQSLLKGKVEVKAGYLANDSEFVGFYVGGYASNGSVAVSPVYSTLPFEAGMSYLPLTAPGLNTTFHTPDHTYLKIGLQRSLDPGGGTKEESRDAIGLRFDPKGDGLLALTEIAYKVDAAPGVKQTWARTGYMYNDTSFQGPAVPMYSSIKPPQKYYGNNQAVYLLADRQIAQPDPAKPANGLFLGFSAEYAPPTRNSYTQYYEFRIYQKGPFTRRPDDFWSLIGSHTDYSEYSTRAIVKAGKTAWNSSTSVTASYTTRLRPGIYNVTGLSYTDGPTIVPRVHNSLNLTSELSVFF